ncbi:hypothetical protein [Streptomyces macrosporus]|uniref:Uncharacterized protein n=1 Tax=Streptomyces macrosporus TaxID=44032 RepID=A0ABN3K147_9ACTN
MTERSSLPLRALPGGRAELRVVLHLDWQDLAVLGQEAGRLAGRLQRAVTLDEAVSHRLSAREASPAASPAGEGPVAPAADPAPAPAPAAADRPAAESGRHAAGRRDEGSGSVAQAQAGVATIALPDRSERAAQPEKRPADTHRTLERISLASSAAPSGGSPGAESATVPATESARAAGTAG